MPETTPAVPVGLATKLGVIVGALSSLLAVVTLILHGDYSEETLGALIVAAVNFYAVIRGRMDQATAQAAKPQTVALAGAEIVGHTEFFNVDNEVASEEGVTDAGLDDYDALPNDEGDAQAAEAGR